MWKDNFFYWDQYYEETKAGQYEGDEAELDEVPVVRVGLCEEVTFEFRASHV